MGEAEQDQLLGKAVREHANAQRTIEFLSQDASHRRYVCECLAAALKSGAPEIVATQLERFLQTGAGQNFDWSKLTEESLSKLASGLTAAIEEEKKTAEVEQRLKAGGP